MAAPKPNNSTPSLKSRPFNVETDQLDGSPGGTPQYSLIQRFHGLSVAYLMSTQKFNDSTTTKKFVEVFVDKLAQATNAECRVISDPAVVQFFKEHNALEPDAEVADTLTLSSVTRLLYYQEGMTYFGNILDTPYLDKNKYISEFQLTFPYKTPQDEIKMTKFCHALHLTLTLLLKLHRQNSKSIIQSALFYFGGKYQTKVNNVDTPAPVSPSSCSSSDDDENIRVTQYGAENALIFSIFLARLDRNKSDETNTSLATIAQSIKLHANKHF